MNRAAAAEEEMEAKKAMFEVAAAEKRAAAARESWAWALSHSRVFHDYEVHVQKKQVRSLSSTQKKIVFDRAKCKEKQRNLWEERHMLEVADTEQASSALGTPPSSSRPRDQMDKTRSRRLLIRQAIRDPECRGR
eukprot:CAMPEP_0174726646 /NCGR_PEP_ID=MMETSP1094-20130205/48225_1 /TAXON_ID=156173 /ORGANISM="Chrysochromulina brevifilum, Strain UTEX LB 985" /LENGTH=134 /DNA_ID=CAMNT_0015928261 /DNA_START=51 /DNA_END=455 /DNA_ORIENTATION=-